MSMTQLRMECLKQAVALCVQQRHPGGPRSDDVLSVAQKFYGWVIAPPGSARDEIPERRESAG